MMQYHPTALADSNCTGMGPAQRRARTSPAAREDVNAASLVWLSDRQPGGQRCWYCTAAQLPGRNLGRVAAGAADMPAPVHTRRRLGARAENAHRAALHAARHAAADVHMQEAARPARLGPPDGMPLPQVVCHLSAHLLMEAVRPIASKATLATSMESPIAPLRRRALIMSMQIAADAQLPDAPVLPPPPSPAFHRLTCGHTRPQQQQFFAPPQSPQLRTPAAPATAQAQRLPPPDTPVLPPPPSPASHTRPHATAASAISALPQSP